MIYTIENEFLSVAIKTKGAELSSIKAKENNLEYLWQGIERYWPGQSPVLFPTVGKVRNNQYTLDGKVYELLSHGFGRHSEFTLVEKTDSEALFELNYSEETLEVYPFKFKFQIRYVLKERSLYVKYKVINADDKDMYFSLGGHPGFNCPLFEDETMEDYFFELDKKETADLMLVAKGGFFLRETKRFLEDSNIIPLSEELFKKDALVFAGLNSENITLKSRKHNKSVTVNFKGFPYLALWSRATGGPFVCVEPWFSHGDYVDFEGDFKDREGTLTLAANKEFDAEFTISIKNV